MQTLAKVKLAASAILLSAPLTLTQAFHLDEGGHGGITRDALAKASITVNGRILTFSDDAKHEIKIANYLVDLHQATASFHFDDESFPDATGRINTLKEEVINFAKGGDGKTARESLGGALHTLQDYFAHSDQADRNQVIPNFGVDTLPGRDLADATCTGSFLNPGSTLLANPGLTSGFFKVPLCIPPDGKCKHGLPICPGINKDDDTHPLHPLASSNAVTASIKFIMSILTDPRMTSDPKAIKRLLDIRPTIGTVIDDTGSMGGVIAGVKAGVTLMVNSLKDGPDEPDKYLFERFGDPTVGAAITYTDADSFLGAVSSIVPSGGGDCPEFSMSGAFIATVAADKGSRLFIYTDASAKDSALMSAVASLAFLKRIQVTTVLSGNCSPYDPTYFELARRTGGQVFITTHSETGTTLANLMQPLVRNDVHLILQGSLNLTGPQQVLTAPVDETVSQAVFSVGMITKGIITVRRPNGAPVLATDPGVTITDTVGARNVTVNTPEPGNWKIEVTGTGVAIVTATAATSSYLHTFDFANLLGRTGHQGLFPIDGKPVTGKNQTVRAVLFGSAAPSEFSFRRPDGTVISRFTMTNNNPLGATKEEYVGDVIPPLESFLVYVSGTTPGGLPFQRAVPGQQVSSSVDVRTTSDLTSVPAGRTTAIAYSVTNYGNAATFNLTAAASKNFLSPIPPAAITLEFNESRTVTINVTPPVTTPAATEFAVTLTASAGADGNSNSSTTLLKVDPANRDPVCSAASASPAIIRQVNHKMVPVAIVGVTDPDNDPVQIKVTAIGQDEPLSGLGSGNTLFDAAGVGASSVQVRAERSGQGDGRVYRIAFDALDGKGGKCSGSVKVEVPHDNRISAPDGGSAVKSTASI